MSRCLDHYQTKFQLEIAITGQLKGYSTGLKGKFSQSYLLDLYNLNLSQVVLRYFHLSGKKALQVEVESRTSLLTDSILFRALW